VGGGRCALGPRERPATAGSDSYLLLCLHAPSTLCTSSHESETHVSTRHTANARFAGTSGRPKAVTRKKWSMSGPRGGSDLSAAIAFWFVTKSPLVCSKRRSNRSGAALDLNRMARRLLGFWKADAVYSDWALSYQGVAVLAFCWASPHCRRASHVLTEACAHTSPLPLRLPEHRGTRQALLHQPLQLLLRRIDILVRKGNCMRPSPQQYMPRAGKLGACTPPR